MRVVFNIKKRARTAPCKIVVRMDASSTDTVAERNFGESIFRDIRARFEPGCYTDPGDDPRVVFRCDIDPKTGLSRHA